MKIENWGQIEYSKAQAKQLELVEKLASGKSEETIVFCSHDPVVTLGRGTKPEDLFGWQGSKLETSRGGRATYHGPSQVVVYPILDLKKDHKDIPAKDIHAYIRVLEKAVVKSLGHFDIKSEARNTKPDPEGPSLTGVWVGERKIASIGIAVKKWITYHGVAINLENDVQAFSGINPCGFQSNIMTSVEEVLNNKISREDFESVFQKKLTQCI